MFKLFAVSLENFKCFYGVHEFEFPQEPGLFYLTGRNQFNSRLGANAVGKSSLIDAIEWIIYGKTSRGLRAGDIVSWGKKKCKASVTLMVGEEEVEITRIQSPNSLSINGSAASQDEVSKLIRLNQEAFNNSIILPQFGESFFDLSPTKKLEIFSQVMNLDYWLDRSRAASAKADTIANNISNIENLIYKAEGRLESTREQIKDLESKSKDFADKAKDEVEAHEQEIKRQTRVVDKARKKLKRLAKRSDGLDDDLKEIKKELIEAGEEFSAIEKRYMDYITDTKSLLRYIKDLNIKVEEAEKQRNTVCPTCEQPIDDKHISNKQSGHKSEIKKAQGILDDLERKIAKLEDKRTKHRQEVLEIKVLRDNTERAAVEITNKANSLKRDIQHADELIKAAEGRIKKLQDQENPFDALIAKSKQLRKKLKIEVKEHSVERDKLKSMHEAYSYWIGGFKRVRLFVLEEALLNLEIEVNNLLVSLGLVDWTIKFDVERETKSGTISKGFSVFIHSPRHDKPVKFEAWSGGETQRLRLAGDLGLANLIMEQAGFTSHIEIIDEPSEHMSPEGIEDMLETLHQRAHDTGKSIWLVDHNTMEFSGFSGTLTAIMDEKGKAHLEYMGVQ